jgi:DNA modification methylase
LVIQGDARKLPLPDESIDLIVTSPPYFALRSYSDTCERCRVLDVPPERYWGAAWAEHQRLHHHYDGQVGSEATPAAFVDALVECTAEMARVLKPEGSIFVNLGDKYAAGHGGSSTEGKGVNLTVHRDRPAAKHPTSKKTSASRAVIVPGTRPKSLMGLPWRYALRCIDDLGLILRAELVWDKPNALPESVTDRVRRSHEQWFHMVKQPRYFSAVDEIRQPYSDRVQDRTARYAGQSGDLESRTYAPGSRNDADNAKGILGFGHNGTNPLGALPGSVWSIPSEPLTVPDWLGVDHFAAFPSEWPRRLILGWSPSGICTACGQGRRPIIDKRYATSAEERKRRMGGVARAGTTGLSPQGNGGVGRDMTVTVTGYACACPTADAPTRPSVILDPFGGTGTVAAVAHHLGRIGVSCDLSFDYSRLARWRADHDGALRAKVTGRFWADRQTVLPLESV